MKLFKLKKNSDATVCQAMRCQLPDPTELPGDLWGITTARLCQRHAELAIEFARGSEPTSKPTTTLVRAASDVPEATTSLVRDAVSEGGEVLQVVREYTIDTHADLVQVSEWLQMVKAKRNELERSEKDITDPLNKALQKVRDLFRPAKKFWADAELILKGKIGAVKLLEDARNREALEEAARAHAAGNTQAVVAATARVTTTADLKGITSFTKWKYIIEDEEKFMREAPDQYKMPNDRMLREHCSHSTDRQPAAIPGVKFIPDAQVNARAAS